MKLIEKRGTKARADLLALVELCAILDALIFFFSLTILKGNLRTKLLFSDWLLDQEEKHTSTLFKKRP